MKSKPYSKYKASGVEWLGDVPEHWGVKRLKYQVTINDETLPETTDPDYELLYVDISSVNPSQGITKKEQMVFENAPSRARRNVRDGDTIVSTVRTYLRAIAPVIEPEDNLIVSTGFAVIRPKKINQSYLSSVVRAPYFIEEVVSRSVGVSYPAINASEIGLILIPLPPIHEQQVIAAFLDRETERIDSLIAKNQRLMKLLAEQRTVCISRAVTKGLDTKVKMKPSGVEWLGDVPEHWGVKKLKHVFPRLLSGVSTNSESNAADDNELGVLKTSCVYGNKFIPSENKKIVDDEISRASCPVRKNSLIISRMNTPELVGNCGYVDQDYINLFLPDRLWIATFTSKSGVNSKYAWFIIISDAYRKLTGALATGTSDSMKNLSQDAFLNIPIPLPPLPEQQAITAFLDGETAKIDALSAKVTTIIEKLKEYRTALISSAVTGKIDVSTELNTGVREGL